MRGERRPSHAHDACVGNQLLEFVGGERHVIGSFLEACDPLIHTVVLDNDRGEVRAENMREIPKGDHFPGD